MARVRGVDLALLMLVVWSLVDFGTIFVSFISDHRDAIKAVIALPMLLALSMQRGLSRFYLFILSSLFVAFAVSISHPSDSFNFTYASRFAGFVLFFLFFYTAFAQWDVEVGRLVRVSKIVMVILSAQLLCSLLVGKESTYLVEDGFGGATGGFYSANQLSYLVSANLASIFLGSLLRHGVLRRTDFLWCLLGVLNCVLLSTKIALFFAVLILAMAAVSHRKFIYLLAFFSMLILVLMDSFFEYIAVLGRFLFFLGQHGVFWAITSGRSERIDMLSVNFVNIIPVANLNVNFEMDIFDSLINMGLAGFALYLIALLWAIKKSWNNRYAAILTLAFVVASMFSGHLFNAVAVSIYVAAYLALAVRFGRKLPRPIDSRS